MLQELSDQELEMVNGSSGAATGFGNITVTTNIAIVYAPVIIVNSTISQSNIDNANAYVQNSTISHN